MRRFLLLWAFLFFLAGISYSQTTSDCPANLVCITREAAQKALRDADEVIVLRAELKAKDEAYAKLKDVLADMREHFARASGENTILKQRAVSDAAMIELLAKLVRPKKFGVINF